MSPGVGAALDQLDFEGLFNANAAVPGTCEQTFIPYRSHVYAAATTMTRAEFVEFNAQEARDLRQAILQSDNAPGALLALAGDEQVWVDLYLAALEDAGILRPDGDTPPIRERQYIVSLMSTLASGILFGPGGSDVRSTGDLLGFFDQLRELYGHRDGRLAAHTLEGRQCDNGKVGDVRNSVLPEFEDYDLGLFNPTHFEAFTIYVPWVEFHERAAGLPIDFQINGPAPFGGDAFESLDFASLLEGDPAADSLASITGPQTVDTGGWLPADALDVSGNVAMLRSKSRTTRRRAATSTRFRSSRKSTPTWMGSALSWATSSWATSCSICPTGGPSSRESSTSANRAGLSSG